MEIRRPTDADREAVLKAHNDAFGPEEGPEIVELIGGLLEDETARPYLSLLAEVDGKVAGHVLFTAVSVQMRGRAPVSSLLAPLAVVPEAQSRGIGARLVSAGLEQLAASGVELVFVLGHPTYYPRFGFRPAGALGLDAPYPIPERNADAWMVVELEPGAIRTARGKVRCAAVLRDEKYWTE